MNQIKFLMVLVAICAAGCSSADVDVKIVTQPCTDMLHIYSVPGANQPDQWYDARGALFKFPGRTWEEIFASVAPVPRAITAQEPYWDWDEIDGPVQQLQAYFKDGEVGVVCNPNYPTVTIAVHGGL